MSVNPSSHAPQISSDVCRIALISTPRSGNTWVTHMVAKAFELTQLWAHSPNDVDWDKLPERIVLQLHWQQTPDFREQLRAHNFRVVVMSRHPLDVLISILVYSQHDSSTLNWLAGAGGDERSLSGASPLSEPFLNYAIGPRATALLGVSREWWKLPEVCNVRYEDLLENCQAQMERVVASVGQPVRVPLTQVVEEFRPSATREISVQFLFHVWSAQAGLWRQLIPASIARRIYDAHCAVFETLGYECRPDETLGTEMAQTTWDRLDFAGLKRNVNGLKRRVQECELREHADINNLHEELHRVDLRSGEATDRLGLRFDELQCLHGQLAGYVGNLFTQIEHLQSERKQLLEGMAGIQKRLDGIDGLSPWSLHAARRFQSWARCFPKLTAAMKSVVSYFFPRGGASDSGRPLLMVGRSESGHSQSSAVGMGHSLKKAS